MMKNGNKKKLDGNSFLLVVTIVLFFAMYIVGIIMYGDRGFAKVQNCGGYRHDHCHDYRRN